jgi:NAD(P)-dependent dehydrogenase (short-subunit alcohol dehydrogenase family)
MTTSMESEHRQAERGVVPRPYANALIVGAGEGISASLARLMAAEGMRVALAARNIEKLSALSRATDALLFACDAGEPEQVDDLFEKVDAAMGAPDVVVYNAGGGRVRGPLVGLPRADVESAIRVGAFGGFLVSQQAAKRMIPNAHGAILLTGASASVKGYAQSAPFAMSKFALRGLAQSMARELGPLGIHVAHFVIDGAVRQGDAGGPAQKPDALLDADAIAATYLHVLRQPRSTWTWEVEMRPWLEKF